MINFIFDILEILVQAAVFAKGQDGYDDKITSFYFYFLAYDARNIQCWQIVTWKEKLPFVVEVIVIYWPPGCPGL